MFTYFYLLPLVYHLVLLGVDHRNRQLLLIYNLPGRALYLIGPRLELLNGVSELIIIKHSRLNPCDIDGTGDLIKCTADELETKKQDLSVRSCPHPTYRNRLT
jgi:hypothetical protein